MEKSLSEFDCWDNRARACNIDCVTILLANISCFGYLWACMHVNAICSYIHLLIVNHTLKENDEFCPTHLVNMTPLLMGNEFFLCVEDQNKASAPIKSQ